MGQRGPVFVAAPRSTSSPELRIRIGLDGSCQQELTEPRVYGRDDHTNSSAPTPVSCLELHLSLSREACSPKSSNDIGSLRRCGYRLGGFEDENVQNSSLLRDLQLESHSGGRGFDPLQLHNH